MKSRETMEANLSALFDGELAGSELLETLDALAASPELQRFWSEMRRLQDLAAPPLPGAGAEPPPEHLWRRIARRGRLGKTGRARTFRLSSRAWAAAAMLLIGIGLAAGGVLRLPVLRASDEPVEVTLGEDVGKMTEERFIALTTELLRADRRYHRKMLEVLEAVTAGEVIEEGSMDFKAPRRIEEPAGESESLAELPPDETVPSSADRQRINPMEIQLW